MPKAEIAAAMLFVPSGYANWERSPGNCFLHFRWTANDSAYTPPQPTIGAITIVFNSSDRLNLRLSYVVEAGRRNAQMSSRFVWPSCYAWGSRFR